MMRRFSRFHHGAPTCTEESRMQQYYQNKYMNQVKSNNLRSSFKSVPAKQHKASPVRGRWPGVVGSSTLFDGYCKLH